MKFGRKSIFAFCLLAAGGIGSASFAQAPQPAAPEQSKAAPKRAATPAAQLLDINTATEDELRALKGIGDKRAADIIQNRPYKGKDELVQKKIIPDSIYAGIKDKIIAKQNWAERLGFIRLSMRRADAKGGGPTVGGESRLMIENVQKDLAVSASLCVGPRPSAGTETWPNAGPDCKIVVNNHGDLVDRKVGVACHALTRACEDA